MDESTKLQFIMSALPKMAEFTLPFLTSVIGIPDPSHGELLGSGVRCVLNGRRVILTAAHVIDEALKYDHFAVTAGHGVIPYLVNGRIDWRRSSDLAIYYLPSDFPLKRDKEFWEEQKIERSMESLSTDYLFVHGFPGKQARFLRLLEGIVCKSLPYGAMQRLENLPKDIQNHEFAIEYDPEGMVNERHLPAEIVDPHGLSGSPVFRLGLRGSSTRDWSPQASLLVGVVTGWNPQHKVLVATSLNQLSVESHR